MSRKLFATIGSPSPRFSGKMKSKFGSRNWPEPKPFAAPTGTPGWVGSNGRVASVWPPSLEMIISRVGGMNLPPNTWKRNRPTVTWVNGSTVPSRRSVSSPVQGSTSTALMSMRFVGSVVKPTMKMRLVVSSAMVLVGIPLVPSKMVSTLT